MGATGVRRRPAAIWTETRLIPGPPARAGSAKVASDVAAVARRNWRRFMGVSFPQGLRTAFAIRPECMASNASFHCASGQTPPMIGRMFKAPVESRRRMRSQMGQL